MAWTNDDELLTLLLMSLSNTTHEPPKSKKVQIPQESQEDPEESDELVSCHSSLPRKREMSQNGAYPSDVKSALIAMMNRAPIKDNGMTYPTEEQKEDIMKKTGLTLIQINNFASNHRRRVQRRKKPRV